MSKVLHFYASNVLCWLLLLWDLNTNLVTTIPSSLIKCLLLLLGFFGGWGGESSCLSVSPCVWLCPEDMNCATFCNQIWCGGASFIHCGVECHVNKLGCGLCSKVYIIKICFDYIFWTSLMIDHHRPKYWIAVFKVKVTTNVKFLIDFCLDDMLWTAEPFVMKLSLVINTSS